MSIILGPPVGQNRVKTPERQIDPGPPGSLTVGKNFKDMTEKGRGRRKFFAKQREALDKNIIGLWRLMLCEASGSHMP